MKVARQSPWTRKWNVMELDVTPEQLDQVGMVLIQKLFPRLTPAEREFIKSGYTQADWDEMFPPLSE